MLSSKLLDARGRAKTLHTAWLRADCVLRDEKLGILQKLVRTGLQQVMIGVERDDTDGLAFLNKHNNEPEICREAFAIFREKYPQVYTIGTVIFGLPGDTVEDLEQLASCQYEMQMDYCFFIPLTPNPGTAIAEEALHDGRIANNDLASYNFHTPVCNTKELKLCQLESIYWRIMLNTDPRRFIDAWRPFLSERDRRKRRVHFALMSRGATIATKSLLKAIISPRKKQPTLYSRRPSWYDK